MVMGQHEARRSAPEGALEQNPIGQSERATRAGGYQFVTQKGACAVEIDEQQSFVAQPSQKRCNTVDEILLKRKKQVARTYHFIQAGSFPSRCSRLWCATVPASKTSRTKNVGPLFITM